MKSAALHYSKIGNNQSHEDKSYNPYIQPKDIEDFYRKLAQTFGCFKCRLQREALAKQRTFWKGNALIHLEFCSFIKKHQSQNHFHKQIEAITVRTGQSLYWKPTLLWFSFLIVVIYLKTIWLFWTRAQITNKWDSIEDSLQS